MNLQGVTWTLIAVCGIGMQVAAADSDRNRAQARLPDWSGWWIWELFAPNAQPLGKNTSESPLGMLTQLPLKPEYMADMQKALQADSTGQDVNKLYDAGPRPFCEPFRFIGMGVLGLGGLPGDPEAEMEFLFTPGRVTVIDEVGRLRRIFTAGQPVSDLGETNTGISIGHWEGQVLVVETTHLNSQARIGGGPTGFSGPRLGKNAHVTERIFLKSKDVLQVDMTVVAPDMFTAPYKSTALYVRDHGHEFHEFSYCNEYDREIDPVTGHQRFDMKPPEDLPPPPPP